MDMILNPNLSSFKLPIIEAFVKVYGEEYRPLIIERIDNVEIMFYNNPTQLGYYITKIKQLKNKELLIKFFTSIGVILTDEDKKEIQNGYGENEKLKSMLDYYFGWGKSIDTKMDGIDSFRKEYDDCLKDKDCSDYIKNNIVNNRIKFLKFLGFEVTNENYMNGTFDKDRNYQMICTIIESQLKVKLDLEKELTEYNDTIRPYTEYVDREKNREREIEHKKLVEFMNELGDLVPSEDKKALLGSDALSINSLNSVKMYACSYGFSGDAFTDAFSRDSFGKLNNPKCSDYDRKKIVERQINFLKNFGVNITMDNYQEYIKNDDIKKLIPSYEEIDRISALRTKKQQEARNEFIAGTNDYISIQEKFKNLSLVYQGFDTENMDKSIICVVPNEQVLSMGTKVKPSLFFTTTGALPTYVDVQFIHELVHVIELSGVIAKDEDQTTFRCGFDIVTMDKNDSKEDDGIKREYELINEVITQMVAMEATSKLHEAGTYIFEDKEQAKVMGATSYEHGNMFIANLYKRYKPDILQAKITGDVDTLNEKLGVGNLAKLNEVVNAYFKLPYYNLMNAIMNKENDNPLVQEFNQLVAETRAIYGDIENTYQQTIVGRSL